MNPHLARVVKAVFWLLTVAIPVSISLGIEDFIVEQRCMVGTACLQQALPLIMRMIEIKWGAELVLWPAAAWNLGGHWLWLKFLKSRRGEGSPTVLG